MNLDALSVDALTEIFNLGVGQAASAFSQIAGESVQLTVPRVLMLSRNELADHLALGGVAGFSAVRQRFSGAIQSEAVLMFPADRGLQLVRMMVGGEVALDQLAEMEQEALLEIGNILLNSVMASVADELQAPMDGDLPTLDLSLVQDLVGGRSEGGAPVLLIDIQFEVAAQEVRGLLAFLLDVGSWGALEQMLSHYTQRLA